jgi:microsomal dipeptidase-like Zn-dependent dipeptidase
MKHKTLLSRRELIKRAGLASAAVVAAPMIHRGRFRLFANSVTEYSRQAIDLIGRAMVIDMLNVLTLDFNKQAKWFKDPETFTTSDLQPYLDSGINVMHPAIGMGGPNAPVEHVLDHFDHVRKLIGPEHLGVGSDIDLYGYDAMPADLNKQLRAGYKGSYAFREKIDIEGLNHPKRIFDLTEGLIRRKYSDADIEGILGGNFERVLTEIWT